MLQQSKTSELLGQSYKFAESVKVIIKFLFQAIHDSNYFVMVKPKCTLMQLKQELLKRHNILFNFFIKESFMPTLDSKIGDLAFCYGKPQVDKETQKPIYEIKMVCCKNLQYG